MTRLEAIKARGDSPELPPLPAKHVLEWWLEIGPTSGDGAVTWQELTAWERITGIELEPWEARAIRAMSVAFRSENIAARKANRPPPWSVVGDEVRNKVAGQLEAMAKAFAANLQGKRKDGK